jgi:hypothetical protein
LHADANTVGGKELASLVQCKLNRPESDFQPWTRLWMRVPSATENDKIRRKKKREGVVS